MRCVNTVYAAATFSKCRAVFVRQQQNTCRLRRRLQQSKHTQAVRRSSNTPSSPPEPTGFRQKKGSVPQFLSDYKAEKAADSGNGLLFSDKILHGPVKYGIWALSAGLGAYALLEMPVPPGTKDHVFADIRAWYVEQKYKFFGVQVPASTEASGERSISDASDTNR